MSAGLRITLLPAVLRIQHSMVTGEEWATSGIIFGVKRTSEVEYNGVLSQQRSTGAAGHAGVLEIFG